MARLGRELVDEAVVEHPPAGREREHAALVAQVDRVDAVEAAQRGVHDVDAQDHPGAAAERRVVDLAAAERRVLARVERAQLVAVRQRVGDVALAAEPLEPLREERDDVELHQARRPPGEAQARRSPRKARSTSMTPAATSTERTASRTRAATSRSAAALARRPRAPRTTAAATHAARRRPTSARVAVDDPAALEVLGVPLVLARAPARPTRVHEQVERRAAPRPPRGRRWPASRRIGRSSVPARRTISASPSPDAHRRCRAPAAAARARHVERAVEPVGPADAAGREPVDARPRHVSRRCRRARGGSP